MNTKYPIYIISKGRWEQRATVKALDLIDVDYKIVIEPQEYKNYASVIDSNKILILPFNNLGQGSIPARNWIWEHSKFKKYKRHWILDDNISCFYRFNHNLRVQITDGAAFRAIEDFSDRYENVAISGMQYAMFAPSAGNKPFTLNTRIYSCILLNNSIDYQWRGRYNEDTDLSLRVLKDGWCTILINAFLCQKCRTLSCRGGNTDELYKGDGRLLMARSLYKQHPDIVKITWRYNRWQHLVDYTGFKKNKLIRRKDIVVKNGINNYGMKLFNTDD